MLVHVKAQLVAPAVVRAVLWLVHGDAHILRCQSIRPGPSQRPDLRHGMNEPRDEHLGPFLRLVVKVPWTGQCHPEHKAQAADLGS